MNLIVLYFSLVLAFFQGGLFNSNELNSDSKFEIIEQIILQKPLAAHHDFQHSIFVIDEENEDDISCFKNKLIAKRIFVLTHHFSKLFYSLHAFSKVKFDEAFISPTSSSIFILNSVFLL